MNNPETHEFERLYQIELDRIYKELGYQVVKRIQGKQNRYYDLILSKNGKEAKIEEKGLTYYHRDCPIELIQNIWPPSRGWFYETMADYIHFFYYKEKTPYVLYQLSFNKLKENLSNIFKEKKARPRLSTIHFGITINICIPWQYLIKKNYVVILKKSNNFIRQHELFLKNKQMPEECIK